MAEVETKVFPIEALREFSTRMFLHFGVPKYDAVQAAEVLATADLRGIDSHGVARLHSYFDMLTLGRINPRPEIKVLRSTPSTATIDGDNGLGLVVGPHANRFAMDMAERFGSGWVSVQNSNHYGIAGYYVLKALERNLIGWAMTNSTKLVAPLWGAERMLGTNPIAIGFPGKEEPPIVIDMATSAAAYGKIEIARRRGEPIPEGWAVDGEGRATTNPNDMVNGGALLPLGSDRERGGHKGYGLAIMVDILCGVLSGANWGPFTPHFSRLQTCTWYQRTALARRSGTRSRSIAPQKRRGAGFARRRRVARHRPENPHPLRVEIGRVVNVREIQPTGRESTHPAVESCAPRESFGPGAPVRIAFAKYNRDF